ncbi:MAG: hypothetical protein DCC55_16980 [Chloroflexi bacterium]|nr:MAG: hypothetical protein DCC55_16980 [Chloroflexota bacterium]
MNQTNSSQLAQSTLESYRGKKRLLLIFAPAETDPAYQKQLELLDGHTEACNARDIVIARLFADGESNFAGTQSASSLPLELREEFGIAEDEFALLLVDKAGDVQLRTDEPTALEEIFELVD